MKGLRQGIRSTKEKEYNKLNNDDSLQLPIKKEHDVFFKIVEMKDTIYTARTGQFPYIPTKVIGI